MSGHKHTARQDLGKARKGMFSGARKEGKLSSAGARVRVSHNS